MKSIISASVFAVALAVASLASAKVEIKGNNEQTTTIKNGAVANTAVGMGAKAKMSVNSVEGNVKIGGNNKQTFSLTNGAVANTAVGMGTKAEMNLGTISGK